MYVHVILLTILLHLVLYIKIFKKLRISFCLFSDFIMGRKGSDLL